MIMLNSGQFSTQMLFEVFPACVQNTPTYYYDLG